MAKEFKENAAMELIEATTKEAPAPKKRRKKKNMVEVPFGYMVAPEPQSERLTLLVKKSVRDLLDKDVEATGLSINKVVNRILEEYYSERG